MPDASFETPRGVPADCADTAAWLPLTRRMVITLCAGVILLAPCFAFSLNRSGLAMRSITQNVISAGWRVEAKTVTDETDGLRASPDENGCVTVRAPRIDLSADACPTPELFVSASGNLECMLVWERLGDPTVYRLSQTFRGNAVTARRRIAFDELAFQPGWVGPITSLAWQLRVAGGAVVLHEAGAPAAGARKWAAMLWRQWWWRDPIEPHTINTIRAPHVLGYSPPTILGVAAAIILAGYIGMAAGRRTKVRPRVLVAVVVTAWLANDLRWAVGQQRQITADAARFAGAVLPDAQDNALYPPAVAVMNRMVRQALPKGTVYAVIGGDLTNGDRRLRYLLAPDHVQINLDPLQPRVPVDRADYVLVLDPNRASIDAATGVLRAERFPTWRVTKILEMPGGPFIARRDRP